MTSDTTIEKAIDNHYDPSNDGSNQVQQDNEPKTNTIDEPEPVEIKNRKQRRAEEAKIRGLFQKIRKKNIADSHRDNAKLKRERIQRQHDAAHERAVKRRELNKSTINQ